MDNSSYGFKGLLYGLMCLALSIMGFRQIWQSRVDLIPVSGTLQDVNVYFENNIDSRGRANTSSSLTFSLNEHRYIFQLIESLEDDANYKFHNHLSRSLQHADSITVMIKKKEADELQPKVQEIIGDSNILLSFDEQRLKNRGVTVFLFVGAIFCLGLFIIDMVPKYRNQMQDFLK